MDPQDEVAKLQKDLEYRLLKSLVEGMKDESIPLKEAKEIATVFLGLEPFSSLDELKAKMNTFSQQFPQYEEFNAYVTAFIDEKGVRHVIHRMQEHLDSSDIDGALEVAQKKHE